MAKKIARTAAPMHPGLVAAETLDELEIPGREAAREIGLSAMGLNKVLNGKVPVTPETAVRLEAYLGLDAKTWLAMQAEHDLWNARQKLAKDLAKIRRAKGRAAAR